MILPAPADLPRPGVVLSVDARGDALVRIANARADIGHAPISFLRITGLNDRSPNDAPYSLFSSVLSADSCATFRIREPSRDVTVRVERLIIAGT